MVQGMMELIIVYVKITAQEYIVTVVRMDFLS